MLTVLAVELGPDVRADECFAADGVGAVDGGPEPGSAGPLQALEEDDEPAGGQPGGTSLWGEPVAEVDADVGEVLLDLVRVCADEEEGF